MDPLTATREAEEGGGEAKEEGAQQDDEGQGFKNVMCLTKTISITTSTYPHNIIINLSQFLSFIYAAMFCP